MLMPLFIFVFILHSKNPLLWREVNYFLFSERLMFGRVVAVTGLIVFLAACVQLAYVQLLRKDKLVTYGLYSVVRHPQYFGIIGVTLGITIMCIRSTYGGPDVTVIWLVQVLGYILLAGYEERHLMKEHEEYQSYQEKVAFIFPIPDVPKIPETLVSLAVAVLVWFLLTLLNT